MEGPGKAGSVTCAYGEGARGLSEGCGHIAVRGVLLQSARISACGEGHRKRADDNCMLFSPFWLAMGASRRKGDPLLRSRYNYGI